MVTGGVVDPHAQVDALDAGRDPRLGHDRERRPSRSIAPYASRRGARDIEDARHDQALDARRMPVPVDARRRQRGAGVAGDRIEVVGVAAVAASSMAPRPVNDRPRAARRACRRRATRHADAVRPRSRGRRRARRERSRDRAPCRKRRHPKAGTSARRTRRRPPGSRAACAPGSGCRSTIVRAGAPSTTNPRCDIAASANGCTSRPVGSHLVEREPVEREPDDVGARVRRRVEDRDVELGGPRHPSLDAQSPASRSSTRAVVAPASSPASS